MAVKTERRSAENSGIQKSTHWRKFQPGGRLAVSSKRGGKIVCVLFLGKFEKVREVEFPKWEGVLWLLLASHGGEKEKVSWLVGPTKGGERGRGRHEDII